MCWGDWECESITKFLEFLRCNNGNSIMGLLVDLKRVLRYFLGI